MTKALAVACVLVASGAGLSAQQAPSDPAANAKLGALRKARPSDSYGKLFELREGFGKTIEQESKNTAPGPKRKIVCGMTVIEVGPELDPKMGVTPPNNDGVNFTVRGVPPPICGAARPE